jgi:hypothetical protein
VRETLDPNTTTTGQYWKAMSDTLAQMETEGVEALNLIIAEGKDNIVSLYSELG